MLEQVLLYDESLIEEMIEWMPDYLHQRMHLFNFGKKILSHLSQSAI